MEKRTKKSLAYVLCALACLVVLALGTHFTVAAFTANSFLKAVAATNQTENLFASDVLAGYTKAPAVGELDASRQSLSLSDSSGQVSFNIEVYNHLKDNKNVVNTKDVTYSFIVQVVGATSLDGYSVSCGTAKASLSGSTFSINDRLLRGNYADTDRFTITMPTADLGKISFVIEAVAQSGSGTNLWGLAAKVVPSKAAKVDSSAVTGKLNLATGEAATNDAYNYEITVTGKEADVTLTWPTDKVEIEPFFFQKYRVNPDKDKGTVTFHLQPGVTTVNFYQKDGRTDVANEDFTCK